MQDAAGKTEYEVEPLDQSSGDCSCCGKETRLAWGFVHAPAGTVASYYVHWTTGVGLDSHPANYDFIIGPWGEGASPADRVVVSLMHFENEDGPGVMVIDAGSRPSAKSGLAASALDRENVVGTEMAAIAFAIFDAVYLQDPRIYG
ncbi:hypothetical protein [Leisingera methylohalidivorans]|uniref:Uncharacterized protein n=1 Tax=Leisingera methylohalidivorans DSM 14336 TaxID=999552 RepID=V9VZS5_9RHOB|nr:hypothetical protein [Leisingera methylohalidivorans]AHD02397.1 hypothetical protein METH_18830 [Leisingera methylohalidivorans DSM 14336]